MANLLRIRNLNLTLASGEWLQLLGASGAGKSRLLRVIAGLDRPVSGERGLAPGVRVELPSRESLELHPRRSVRELLEGAFRPLRRRDLPDRGERRLRIEQAIADFALEDRLERRGGELSGGERRLLATVLALLRRPGIFLFDDFLGGWDAALRSRVVAQLRGLGRQAGCAAVFASQGYDPALGPDCQVMVLHRGALTQLGSSAELCAAPADRAVGELFGMNFLEGRLDVRDGEQVFAYADGETEARLVLSFVHALPRVPDAEPGRGSVTLGIWPAKIRFARTPEELGAGLLCEPALPGERVLPGWEAPWLAIRHERPEREESLIFGSSGGALRLVARVLQVEERKELVSLGVGRSLWEIHAKTTDLRPGDRCWVELDKEALHWFDAQGARLEPPRISEPAEPLPSLALEEDPAERGLKAPSAPRTERDLRERATAQGRGE